MQTFASAIAAVSLSALVAVGAVGAGPASAATTHPTQTSGQHTPAKTPTGKALSNIGAYPYAQGDPTVDDPWGAIERQCTSYASWWLTSHGVSIGPDSTLTGPTGAKPLGDAADWDTTTRDVGYAVVNQPVVGAIAQWHAGEKSKWTVKKRNFWLDAGPTGHVGVVRKLLPKGLAVIDDYNGLSPLAFHEFVGKAPRYLVIIPG